MKYLYCRLILVLVLALPIGCAAFAIANGPVLSLALDVEADGGNSLEDDAHAASHLIATEPTRIRLPSALPQLFHITQDIPSVQPRSPPA